MPHTAEGDYLRERRELAGLTVPQACEGTTMKPDKWGDVERGRTHSSAGRPAVEWHARAPLVAIMASRLGVTPAKLRELGRDDAAVIVERDAASATPALPPPFGSPAPEDAPALDRLVAAFVKGRPDAETIRFLWRATDGEGRLKPLAERLDLVVNWLQDRPAQPAQATLKRA